MPDLLDLFRTNDMAMATFLRLEGHSVQHVYWEAGTCYWAFRVTESLLDLVDDFQNDKAQVNPKQYNNKFNVTKREFYEIKPKS